jgi:predicted TIM-barrel fold metal-dependent hydrolase
MSNYRVISQDNHVFEPEDLWTSRIESKFEGREPHIERLEEGDWWYCDGRKLINGGGGADAGVRFEDPDKLSSSHRMEEGRPGGYIPEEHVKDLEIDGMDVSFIYPTTGIVLYGTEDSDLLTGICSAYNDWVSEFFNAIPERLKGIAMLNVDDVSVGVKELERSAKMGFSGAMIPVQPFAGRLYDQPMYESLWAAAQDLGMPLSLHLSTNRATPDNEFANHEIRRPAFICNNDHWVRLSLADMIFNGVFERYPKLQVGSVEHELSWAPHFLDRMDYTYSQRGPGSSGRRNPLKDGALPSDYFHTNVFLGFQEDALGIRDRHIIGVDNLQWGADYPHLESTFPRSREILENILADCTEEEKSKIVGGNAARVYHLD